jgi:hypothetical protein
MVCIGCSKSGSIRCGGEPQRHSTDRTHSPTIGFEDNFFVILILILRCNVMRSDMIVQVAYVSAASVLGSERGRGFGKYKYLVGVGRNMQYEHDNSYALFLMHSI